MKPDEYKYASGVLESGFQLVFTVKERKVGVLVEWMLIRNGLAGSYMVLRVTRESQFRDWLLQWGAPYMSGLDIVRAYHQVRERLVRQRLAQDAVVSIEGLSLVQLIGVSQ